RLRGGILDCRCARRSAKRQVGTKGWSFPIEQRDAAIDLNIRQRPLYMTNLLNLTHTTNLGRGCFDGRAKPNASCPPKRPVGRLPSDHPGTQECQRPRAAHTLTIRPPTSH